MVISDMRDIVEGDVRFTCLPFGSIRELIDVRVAQSWLTEILSGATRGWR